MLAQSLLKLSILALLLAPGAYADTNIAGEEIITLDDAAAAPSDSRQINPTQDHLTLESYTQDTDPAETAVKNADLWQRIKSGYAMPELQSPITAKHESWYASRPEYVNRMIGRSQKYLYHIVEEVQKRGMPTEIALLPMVESAFNPTAMSTSKASGIWQFIPSTGRNFGLKQTWWVDNRRDVTAATDAALTYLQKLHVMFGTWDLALAAYNAGEGTVMRAIERNRKHGLPTDYQSLQLPPETRNYVPKLQAVKNIVTNPEQYGLNIQPIANQPYFIKVNAPKQIDASLAAKLAGVSTEEFRSLNPEYNRPVLTTTESTHEILLPMGADETFETNLAAYDKPLVSWQSYYAKRGERIENIAKKFGVTPEELREVNGINHKGKFKSAHQLLVPLQSESAEDIFTAEDIPDQQEEEIVTASFSTKRHLVKRGETLGSVAKRYGVSTKDLRAMNHLKSSKLKKGQILLVQVDEDAPKRMASRTVKLRSAKSNYVVRRGDTLSSIARKFDVSTSEIKRWNNLNGSRITPGHKLKILNPDKA
ncbi:MAG TPA: LysM peptidoglycan-binding domain-containing protein [Methylophilaceae bacterium]|jgi:membrane-bound lytic murein transglycosylase D|nr:LysM peptidoglycan-binding domain-containing protein [Methylophilaceae bacterium]